MFPPNVLILCNFNSLLIVIPQLTSFIHFNVFSSHLHNSLLSDFSCLLKDAVITIMP